LKDLRAEAHAARQAVIEEENRQRDAFNGALDALYDRVLPVVGKTGWVVSEENRKHVRMIRARPRWASQHAMLLTFAFAEADTPDLYEDLTANVVGLTDLATGHECRFNHPPHADMLLALVQAYMRLASPPDQ
jgi:ubiquinone/menaquinone biosynthesis C-methylase UbiE